MRQQAEDQAWPLAESLTWFQDKSFSEIIKSNDEIFKNQLKRNALKIATEINKLFHEKVDAWHYLRPYCASFGLFLKALIRLSLSNSSDEFSLTMSERYQLLTFFNYAFNSIEIDFVEQQIRKYLPLSIWINLSEQRRNIELNKLSEDIRGVWTELEAQDERLLKKKPNVHEEKLFERKFVFNYVKQFLKFLRSAVVRRTINTNDNVNEDGNHGDVAKETLELNAEIALYCQRFIEFIIDIESQIPLRRFFHALLEYTNFIERCQLSGLARHKSAEGHLFDQLVELLLLYSRYEIDIMTGDPLTEVEIMRKHEQDILELQKVFWSKYEHLRDYAIMPVKSIDDPSTIYRIVTSFDTKSELVDFLKAIKLIDDESVDDEDKENAPLLATIMMNRYKRHESLLKKINSIPLFPNESVIWDTNLVPDQYYNYEYPLALPKLNLQFLTMSDYLLRNFMLFKNESTYEIRQDIEDGIVRSKCRWTVDGQFATGPKQRMALVIKNFAILDVGKPRLGEKCPSRVRAKVVINMDYVRPEWRREWEQLRRHDTCFLVSFRKPKEPDGLGWPEGTFPAKNSVKFVRGCEIEGLLDSEGKIVDEYIETPKFDDNLRTFHVWLDCNQYQMDQNALKSRKLIVYDKFHLIVRRKPEQNNFKGVLETIRSLINTKFVVPNWLGSLLIGFGKPNQATPSNLRDESESYTLDYHDTFLNYDHLLETLGELKPNYAIKHEPENVPRVPPFKVKFDDTQKELTIIPYKVLAMSPYPLVAPKQNQIKFTKVQAEAITSGLQNGLTMVVGPPGTGKTDVAVQILATLYHSHPNQRTLIVTHSNQALNQIFSKMIELDVQEHHLLRMGHGEEDLDSAKDFSRRGRVRHVLTRRLELLVQANKLALSLGLGNSQGLTCQSAEYFYSYHIESRWKQYRSMLGNNPQVESLAERFPFTKFFEDAPQPLFPNHSLEGNLEVADTCYRYIKQIFDQLQAFRPFEIFSNASDRSKYLLIREAKVIAMTCTHAGLKRKELAEMNFQYDNILMEETAQILEIETAIPLLLQNPENGVNRLKRWIMIGDHNQLPPIIQNSAFQKFSNMEQSLFARFVRLGVPNVELDAQGRARSSLCDLYRWRYKNLKELDIVRTGEEFKRANPGFVHEFQLINVEDYKGMGESTPMPYYYQNRGEAEYVVALYKYMRIIGYPSERITILTTYNGQKQLLKDLIEQECTQDAHIGKPSKITTVDKFQGQQNDYILLSLVRTRTVGHLRDIRRLVVAMSRARLGLYVFARVSLFKNSIELRHSMKLLLQKPQELCLLVDEKYSLTGRMSSSGNTSDAAAAAAIPDGAKVIRSLDEMQQLVANMYIDFMEAQSRAARLMVDDDEDEEGAEKNTTTAAPT